MLFVAAALQCWKCTSDGSSANAVCDDSFDDDLARDRRYGFIGTSPAALINCGSQGPNTQGYPFNYNQQYNQQTNIPVCRKVKYNGKTLSQWPSIRSWFRQKKIYSLYQTMFHVLVNGQTVVTRDCYFENVNNRRDQCFSDSRHPRGMDVEFCETCLTDGCNGAAQYGPAALLIALTGAIAKILSV